MENNKFYIYRFSTKPEVFSFFKGSYFWVEEKEIKKKTENSICVKDFGNVQKNLIDNSNYIAQENWEEGIRYSFFSLRGDRMDDFVKAVKTILNRELDELVKKETELRDILSHF